MSKSNPLKKMNNDNKKIINVNVLWCFYTFRQSRFHDSVNRYNQSIRNTMYTVRESHCTCWWMRSVFKRRFLDLFHELTISVGLYNMGKHALRFLVSLT